jgi:hypothetical protein
MIERRDEDIRCGDRCASSEVFFTVITPSMPVAFL